MTSWDQDVPSGAKLHVSRFADDGAFNDFFQRRLALAIQEIGIQGQPDVKFFAFADSGC